VIAAWSSHACRQCGGTLLERRCEDPAARATFECGTCSLTACGTPDAICGCGILPKPVRASGAPRFRCAPNPDRNSASPALLVIAFDEEAA
jgi:hypothetical protein